ncbi:DNA ligase 4 isoform X6 [Cephus cinctus]|nr:DNA ligase 4 isoform X6 [Cephus cinctus]
MSATLASKIEFKTLCQLFEKISKAEPSKKFHELQSFISQCRVIGSKMKNTNPDADISLFPILRLLLPQLDRERSPYGLKQSILGNLLVKVFCLGKGSAVARQIVHYKAPSTQKTVIGDFAEKVYHVLRSYFGEHSDSLSVEQINAALDRIVDKNKDTEFQKLARELSAEEFKWMIRIVLKDVRLGMGHKKIFAAYHPDANDLFDVTSNVREICDKLIDPKMRMRHDIKIFAHFKPMLCERCPIENIGKFFQGSQQSYYLEMKFDGERSQLHMKDGNFKYFTRNGFDITSNECFGESKSSGGFLSSKIANLLKSDCHSIILDGELMGWHKEDKKFGSKGMNYDVKKLTRNTVHQPCFVAFDIVMYNDELLVDMPLRERLKLLEQAFKEEEGILIRSKTTIVSTSEEVLNFFNKSMDHDEEGIVLKKCEGTYKPIREGSGCYKIKTEYSENLIQDIDLVILGGYYGDGKCRGTVTSFLAGVASPALTEDKEPSEFYAVVRVSSGIKDVELEEMLQKLKNNWTKDCPMGIIGPKSQPPDLWIHPRNSLILQIRASEMTQTVYYPLGYSLRFPRVVKIRNDKPWYSACSVTELKSLVKDTGAVQKLSKRHVTSDDVDEVPITKIPRTRKSYPPTVAKQFTGIRASEVVRLTRLFYNKEFCVINGNDKHTKEDIERLLLEHGATVVQNERGEKTFCVLVGNPKTFKAKNLIKYGHYDVATLDWLFRATKKENWASLQDWYPWELLSIRKATKHRLEKLYDEYYDSYTQDADEESLTRSLEKAEEAVAGMEFTLEQVKRMDRALFENGISPISPLRGIVGYFDDTRSSAKFLFRFMAGIIQTQIDDSVTHVFVSKNNFVSYDRYRCINKTRQTPLILVDEEWIGNCFRDRTLIPLDETYLIDRNI